MMVNSNSTSKEIIIFSNKYVLAPRGRGKREIRTSELRFMRRNPQLIVLLLGVGHKKEKTRFKSITSTSLLCGP